MVCKYHCVRYMIRTVPRPEFVLRSCSLKRLSHGNLKLANSCWQTQVGVCERHKNSRASLRAGSLVPRTGKVGKSVGTLPRPILLASSRSRFPVQTSEPARRLQSANSLPTCLPTVFMPFTHINLSLPTRVC